MWPISGKTTKKCCPTLRHVQGADAFLKVPGQCEKRPDGNLPQYREAHKREPLEETVHRSTEGGEDQFGARNLCARPRENRPCPESGNHEENYRDRAGARPQEVHFSTGLNWIRHNKRAGPLSHT